MKILKVMFNIVLLIATIAGVLGFSLLYILLFDKQIPIIRERDREADERAREADEAYEKAMEAVREFEKKYAV